MISDVLSDFARLNLVCVGAVLLVLALRPAADKLCGARIRYALWTIVPTAGLASLLPAARRVVYVEPPFELPIAPVTTPLLDSMPPPIVTVAAFPWVETLTTVWIVGLAFSIGLLIWRQRLFLDGVADKGPAVIGFLRPRIHLPLDFEDRFTPIERDLIVAHEQAHLTRQDARVNGLLTLIQCVCWFNPFVHFAVWLARQDQEMACDETVVARFPGARKTYAEAMLKTQLASSSLPLGCYWPARAELPLIRRIQMLKTKTPGLRRRIVGASAIALIGSTAGYAAWAAQPAEVVAQAAARAPATSKMVQLAEPQAAAPASRRRPAPQATPAVPSNEVCITNACMKTAQVIGYATIADGYATIVNAIKVGDVRGVIEAGGSAADALAALQNSGSEMRDLKGRTLEEQIVPGSATYATNNRGGLMLGFQVTTQDGGIGWLMLSTGEMAGLAPPPGTPDGNELRGIPKGYVPITEPGPVGPGGDQARRITGYAPPAANNQDNMDMEAEETLPFGR